MGVGPETGPGQGVRRDGGIYELGDDLAELEQVIGTNLLQN